MGHVNFEHVEPGPVRHPGRAGKVVPDLVHIGPVHLLRHLIARLIGPGRGRNDFPVALFEGLVVPLP